MLQTPDRGEQTLKLRMQRLWSGGVFAAVGAETLTSAGGARLRFGEMRRAVP
jgi:hypothetical protein